MWGSSVGVDGLSAADRGSTSSRLPSGARRKPAGVFIQPLAMTTKTELAAPLIAIGIDVSQWAPGLSRFHP